jgi:hypothetical protein
VFEGNCSDSFALPVAVFENENSTRAQESRCRTDESANIPQTVVSAEQCRLRIEPENFWILWSFGIGNVWRVGHDNIYGSIEFGKRRLGVSLHECHSPITQRLDVLSSPLERWFEFLNSKDSRVRDFRRECESQRAGPCSEVDGNRRGIRHLPKRIDCPFGDEFGFRAWDKNTGSDVEHEISERCFTRDVLQRFARFAAGNESCETVDHIIVKLSTHKRLGRHFTASPPRDKSNEQFSVGESRNYSSPSKSFSCVGDELVDRVHDLSASAASLASSST